MNEIIQQIINATSGWSIEITPKVASKINSFRNKLPPKTTVNVTFLPGEDPMETVKVAERLNNDGMNAVPHISARSLVDQKQLDNLLYEFVTRASVDEVLVIGGGVSKPLGEFPDSMSILRTGLLQKYNISKVGVAGHPEGSPDINVVKLESALQAKNDFSLKEGIDLYIETQFCFDPTTVLNWEKNLRNNGINIPIRIGIPGPASIKTLFKFAKLVGIGNSMRFLTKQAHKISKLLTIQSPDNLLSGLSAGMASDPDCLIENFHFYPFGGFLKTVEYADSIVTGNFSIRSNGEFEMNEGLAE